MGCDIHAYVEARYSMHDEPGAMGEWHFADNLLVTYENYNGEEQAVHTQFTYYMEDAVSRFPTRRNYNLFAILANVRNYGQVKLNYISEPRGLPENMSLTTRKLADEWGTDAHSHSWLTINEIISFDWNQKVVIERQLPAVIAQSYMSRSDTNPFTPEEVDKAIEHYSQGRLLGYYGHRAYDASSVVTMEVTYKYVIGEYAYNKIMAIWQYGNKLTVSNEQRVVFWFDN